MSRIRLAHAPSELEKAVPLAEDAPRALEVWHARVGEILTVCSPDGRYYRARLLPGAGEVRPFEALPPTVEPRCQRRLCQAMPEKERMLWIIQKAVELGVTEIQPLRAGAPEEHEPRQDKSATWEKVAREAARQCRRAIIPRVGSPIDLETCLIRARGEGMGWLDPGDDGVSMATASLQWGDRDITLLVGHEGGWRPEERRRMQEAGALRIHLGARVLRTETAALAALAVLEALESGENKGRSFIDAG